MRDRVFVPTFMLLVLAVSWAWPVAEDLGGPWPAVGAAATVLAMAALMRWLDLRLARARIGHLGDAKAPGNAADQSGG